jgi:hypothetical protein
VTPSPRARAPERAPSRSRPIPYRDLIGSVDFGQTRDSAFSYTCHACQRCCYGKAIRVGPYEVLRLSRRLGITTTEFLSRYTEAGGTVLVTKDDTSCVFLDEHGCSVHPDRPLACRIYPLARWVSPEGDESFGPLTPHPQTEGVYGTGGTVGAYLDAQGLGPYFAMGDRYGGLYDRLLEALERRDADEAERRAERRAEIDEGDAGSLASPFLDIDATVARYCAERRLAVPTDVDALVVLHIQAVDAWIATLSIA